MRIKSKRLEAEATAAAHGLSLYRETIDRWNCENHTIACLPDPQWPWWIFETNNGPLIDCARTMYDAVNVIIGHLSRGCDGTGTHRFD
jgi:hypothetical protein